MIALLAVFEVEFKSKKLLLCISKQGWNLHSVGEVEEVGGRLMNHWGTIDPLGNRVMRFHKAVGEFSDLKFLSCGAVACKDTEGDFYSEVLVEYRPHRYCTEQDREEMASIESVDLEEAKEIIMSALQAMGQNVQKVILPKSKEIH